MTPQILLDDLNQFYPELILTAALLCVVIGDIAFPRIRQGITFIIAALGLVLAFIYSIPLFNAPAGDLFFGVIAIDPLAVFFKLFLMRNSYIHTFEPVNLMVL